MDKSKVLVHKDLNLAKVANSGALFSLIHTGDFFEEWNEITHQIHIRKFEELMS